MMKPATLTSTMKKPNIQIECTDEGARVTISDETTEIIWRDAHSYECPEDLIWGRDIGHLFRRAYEMGYRAGQNEPKDGDVTLIVGPPDSLT